VSLPRPDYLRHEFSRPLRDLGEIRVSGAGPTILFQQLRAPPPGSRPSSSAYWEEATSATALSSTRAWPSTLDGGG
jgi:hypothetical protein